MTEKFRLEHDSVGELEVPADAYYGVQSLRGARNVKITGTMMHVIRSMLTNFSRCEAGKVSQKDPYCFSVILP